MPEKSFAIRGCEAVRAVHAQIHALYFLRIGSWNHFSMNCLEWSEPENLQNSEVKSMVEWFRLIHPVMGPEPTALHIICIHRAAGVFHRPGSQ